VSLCHWQDPGTEPLTFGKQHCRTSTIQGAVPLWLNARNWNVVKMEILYSSSCPTNLSSCPTSTLNTVWSKPCMSRRTRCSTMIVVEDLLACRFGLFRQSTEDVTFNVPSMITKIDIVTVQGIVISSSLPRARLLQNKCFSEDRSVFSPAM